MLKKLLLLLVPVMFVLVVAVILFASMSSSSSLEVSVQDFKTANKMQGAEIKVYDQELNLVEEKSSNKNGLASFELSPGNYYVNVSRSGYSKLRRRVTVQDGGVTSIKLSLVEISAQVCKENWECTEWTECSNRTQTRNCTDLNDCGSTEDKLVEEKACVEKCKQAADCKDQNPCTSESCVQGKCIIAPIIDCEDDDGCCPVGCKHNQDNDCVETGECLEDIDCDDGLNCTEDECVETLCYHNTITSCKDGDGCCPLSCNHIQDDDCEQTAQDEGCEDKKDCKDWDACTIDACVNGECEYTDVTSCVDADNCCPSGCSVSEDSDCDQCKKNADCVNWDDCTKGVCSEDTEVHALRCSFMPIIDCIDDDGCCPSGCWHDDDNDCSPDKCITESDCRDGDSCTKDVCDEGLCVNPEITECGPAEEGGCCPDGCTGVPSDPNYDPDCPWV